MAFVIDFRPLQSSLRWMKLWLSIVSPCDFGGLINAAGQIDMSQVLVSACPFSVDHRHDLGARARYLVAAYRLAGRLKAPAVLTARLNI
jgi:hypothetical protein